MKYFAYGSNMSLPRIRARLSKCELLGVYQLTAHQLKFHKKSHDGSAKCDAFYTGDTADYLFGVLLEIGQQDKQRLDEIEGLGAGYAEKRVELSDDTGRKVKAFLYYATHIDPNLSAFDWYHYHVITGAREAHLPANYIASLLQVPQQIDSDRARFAKELSIYQTEKQAIDTLRQASLRRILPGEEASVRQLFYDTIHQINCRDYTKQQIEAWAPFTYDKNNWHKRIHSNDTYVVIKDGQIVGYSELKSDGYIDHFFCHYQFQGQGIGDLLMKNIHNLVAARKINRLYTHASITARPFFERYGFILEKSQQVLIRGQLLTNFVLSKSFD